MMMDLSDIGWANWDKTHMNLRMQFGQTIPERFHKLYMLNAGYIFTAISMIMLPLMPQRVRDKLKMIDAAALLEDFDPSQLPKDLGGTGDWTTAEALEKGMPLLN